MPRKFLERWKIGQMEPLSCDTSGYPLRLPAMYLIDKQIKTKVLKTDSDVNTTLFHLKIHRSKKRNQTKNILVCVLTSHQG